MREIYPEVIRGLWFCFKQDADMASDLASQTCEIYMFRVDGSFVKVVLKDGNKRELEQGQYTFDGQFLITRGRATETYRVTLESDLKWRLQSKKHDLFFIRRLPDALPEMEEVYARDLRILPIRASVQPFNKYLPLSFVLTYDNDGALPSPIRLALLCVDETDNAQGWVGVTRLVTGLDNRTWGRFVKDAFVGSELFEHQWQSIMMSFVGEEFVETFSL